MGRHHFAIAGIAEVGTTFHLAIAGRVAILAVHPAVHAQRTNVAGYAFLGRRHVAANHGDGRTEFALIVAEAFVDCNLKTFAAYLAQQLAQFVALAGHYRLVNRPLVSHAVQRLIQNPDFGG